MADVITDSGPFKLDAIIQEIAAFENLSIQIGWHDNVKPGDTEGISLAGIASVMEFGTDDGRIPARPALSTAIDVGQKEIANKLEDALKDIVEGKRTAMQAARRLGIFGVSLVQKRIRDSPSWADALQDTTIDAKGSSKPLVDTGQLLQSVIWVIIRDGSIVESS